jgi:5'(3')-deoxyribonucleotidase
MSKPVIAVDVDEVLSPFVNGLVPWHNAKYGTNLQFEDFHSYQFNKVWGGDLNEAISKCAFYFENREPVSPLNDAVDVLQKLQKSFELIVVTSRMLQHKSQTESWIDEHFPNIFSAVLICNHWNKDGGPAIKKSTACLNYGARYLIDDIPHYVEDAVSEGVSGLLFGNYPWNRSVTQHPNINRVANWQAVANFFA